MTGGAALLLPVPGPLPPPDPPPPDPPPPDPPPPDPPPEPVPPEPLPPVEPPGLPPVLVPVPEPLAELEESSPPHPARMTTVATVARMLRMAGDSRFWNLESIASFMIASP